MTLTEGQQIILRPPDSFPCTYRVDRATDFEVVLTPIKGGKTLTLTPEELEERYEVKEMGDSSKVAASLRHVLKGIEPTPGKEVAVIFKKWGKDYEVRGYHLPPDLKLCRDPKHPRRIVLFSDGVKCHIDPSRIVPCREGQLTFRDVFGDNNSFGIPDPGIPAKPINRKEVPSEEKEATQGTPDHPDPKRSRRPSRKRTGDGKATDKAFMQSEAIHSIR